MTYELMPLGLLSEGDVLQASHYLQLDPVPRSTVQARRFVGSHAPPALPEETAECLELLTSELVTNAVVHARTAIEVGLLVGRDSLGVGVHDQDLAGPLQDPYADREGGWGLGLVEALAHAWAMTRHPEGGKTAWFRLLRAGALDVADGAAARYDADRRDS